MSAEPKRVSFMTIDTSSDFLKKPEKETTTGNNKTKTLRLNLAIFEPDEYKFPQFNYKKLIHIEKKKQKKLAKLPNGIHNNNDDDPFGGGGEDDDVARIAKEMEAKYGTGSSYSKASKIEFDRGAGYDDNDSFIDNTEAYDEIIPEDVETDRGGFYVNSGLLEFKKMPNFERPGDEIRMPKPKKRALSTTSESSESENEQNKASMSEKPKKKKVHVEKKIKSATSSSDEQGKAKKSKKEKQDKPKEVMPSIKEPEKKKPVEKEATDDSKKVMKTTTVKDMLRAKRDNLRKLEQGKSSGGTTTTTDNDEDDDESESVNSIAVSESSRDSNHQEAISNPINGGPKELSLPSNFSPELIQLVINLKQYAETTAKHNNNFFDNHVKEQLLLIDSSAKSQSSQVRLQVYHQLETFVPCTKKSILSKVSRYRTQQADARIKAEIKKLKTIVNSTMPDLVRTYDEQYKIYENLKNIQHIVGDNTLDHKSPRKRFHWNDNSRTILYDIVQFVDDLQKLLRAKKETSEEFRTRYLKENVVPIWPEGWIKLEDFHKELERKKKKDAKVVAAAVIATVQTQEITQSNINTATNGKTSSSAQLPQQKTELRLKTTSESNDSVGMNGNGNGKSTPKLSTPSTTPGIQVSPQSNSSVIKKASDHSINSIMSTSPSPPSHSGREKSSSSSQQQTEGKTTVIDLEKLTSPNYLLKISQKDASKSSQKYSTTASAVETNVEKVRISDGSDSDCAIIDSPEKVTVKPQQQFSHHLNNNKINHSSTHHNQQQQQQQQGEIKKTKKHDDNYSNLIKSIASLSDPKKSFLSTPLSSPINDQRKMDTSHGVNGTNDFTDPPKPSKGYNNNLHYSINELIVNTNRSGGSHEVIKGNVKSSEYQKQQYTSTNNNNTNIVHNISVITSTNDAAKSSYSMPPILNLSNKK